MNKVLRLICSMNKSPFSGLDGYLMNKVLRRFNSYSYVIYFVWMVT